MTHGDGPTVAELWRMAREVLEVDEVDSRRVRAAVLIMACGNGCGPRLKCLRACTGIPVADVTRVSYYLRRGGIWGRETFYAPWLAADDDEWPINFILQVMVATGEVVACGPDRFKIRTLGDMFGEDCPIPWTTVVPMRPLKRIGGEAAFDEPQWVRRHAVAR